MPLGDFAAKRSTSSRRAKAGAAWAPLSPAALCCAGGRAAHACGAGAGAIASAGTGPRRPAPFRHEHGLMQR
jgi:hypothetical protein